MRKGERNLTLRILSTLFCIMIFGGFVCLDKVAIAAPTPDIKIGLVYPLSGSLSRNGNLTLQSIKASMAWVNENGGIKSMGGAKLAPVIVDSGSTVEGAANAMERVSRDPEVALTMGSWASSLTLASSEVSERVGIPQFSISFVDQLNQRGFKWGFYVTPPMSVYGEMGLANALALAAAAGSSPKTVMILSDNQAASKAFNESAKKYLQKRPDIKVVGEEYWTMGTLTDATPIMQKVKSLNPDLVLYSAGAISEAQIGLMKKREMGIKNIFMGSGGWAADPSFRQVGADFLEGMIAFSPIFPHKLTPPEWIKRSLDQCRKEYSNEPFAGQELTYGWVLVPTVAEVLERAGSRDRKTIQEAARKLDIHDVMTTRATAKQGMAFDETGRLAKKYQEVLIVQWQGGVAQTVFPSQLGVAKAAWPGTK